MTTPHRCPICQGQGTVPPGFYEELNTGTSISSNRPICRTCGGSGLLWESQDFSYYAPLWASDPSRNSN